MYSYNVKLYYIPKYLSVLSLGKRLLDSLEPNNAQDIPPL